MFSNSHNAIGNMPSAAYIKRQSFKASVFLTFNYLTIYAKQTS